MYKLYKGDCLEVMDRLIEEGIKVDAIITDPPYGTTACKWDSIIPFDKMWDRLDKLIKPNGAIVLFGSEPFSSALRLSNIKDYKYDIVWDKVGISNPMLSKKQPLKCHENISLFYAKQPTYNPQMVKGKKWSRGGSGGKYSRHNAFNMMMERECKPDKTDMKYPKTIWSYSNANRTNLVHPTQKPVDLLENLVKTYTNENELVLDFTMGSGSAGVACANTNRKFIGIELDDNYFQIAKDRIEEAYK